jgi:aspartate carbamoyltransferase catalytic subunit
MSGLRHLISIADLDRDDVERILGTAETLAEGDAPDSLRAVGRFFPT